jgi:hypothetical protein
MTGRSSVCATVEGRTGRTGRKIEDEDEEEDEDEKGGKSVFSCE